MLLLQAIAISCICRTIAGACDIVHLQEIADAADNVHLQDA